MGGLDGGMGVPYGYTSPMDIGHWISIYLVSNIYINIYIYIYIHIYITCDIIVIGNVFIYAYV